MTNQVWRVRTFVGIGGGGKGRQRPRGMTIDNDDHCRIAGPPPPSTGVLEGQGGPDIDGAARAMHDMLRCHGLPSASLSVGDNGNIF
jgi:hypothetical protein